MNKRHRLTDEYLETMEMESKALLYGKIIKEWAEHNLDSPLALGVARLCGQGRLLTPAALKRQAKRMLRCGKRTRKRDKSRLDFYLTAVAASCTPW